MVCELDIIIWLTLSHAEYWQHLELDHDLHGQYDGEGPDGDHVLLLEELVGQALVAALELVELVLGVVVLVFAGPVLAAGHAFAAVVAQALVGIVPVAVNYLREITIDLAIW